MKWLWRALFALFALFMAWHEWRGPPLTQAETEALLAELAANRRAGDGNAFADAAGDHDLLQDLRRLAASDDGAQYFMVNLIRFRERALYPPGQEALGTDARAADDRYSAIVVPELLARGSYPIYVSDVAGEFIGYPGAEPWDAVAIVRYRSRRDMLDMVRALQRKGGGMHKWAAIETTHVFPTHASIRVAPLPVLVGMALLLVGTSVQLLVWRRGAAQRQ
jgi:hypothetical protein